MSYEDLPLFAEPAQERTPQVQIVCDDVLAWAEKTPPIGAHAMLCDPPYSLKFMNKAWDGDIAFKPDTWKALAQHLLPGAFIMAFASSRGFHRVMTAMEDAGLRLYPAIFGWLSGSSFPKATRIDTQVDRYNGLAHVHELNTEIARARAESGLSLHDIGVKMLEVTEGQYGTWYHRGGFKFFETGVTLPSRPEWQWLRQVLPIHPTFEHVYDAAEREVLGKGEAGLGKGHPAHDGGYQADYNLTAPATPLAQTWAGHRYGGQMLKNSLEPIIVAQVPYAGKPVQSITETGAGALWIDGGRVGLQGAEQHTTPARSGLGKNGIYGASTIETVPTNDELPRYNLQGRWPQNFALSHTPECVPVGTRQVRGAGWTDTDRQQRRQSTTYNSVNDGSFVNSIGRHYTDANGQETVAAYSCSEQCPVAKLDRQAGVRTSGGSPHNKTVYQKDSRGIYGDLPAMPTHSISDSGSASRFFHVSDWFLDVAEQLAQADPVGYHAKAARTEREGGLLGHLPCLSTHEPDVVHEGDPRQTTRHYRLDTQGQPIRDTHGAITWERCRRNGHPTQKPLTLTQWLATLLLPPDAYAPRRLLVPFCGTSSEMVGAMLAGWEEVLGIEADPGYVEIGRARVSYWTGWKASTSPKNQTSADRATPKTCDTKHRVKQDLTDDSRQQNLGQNLIDG